MPREVPLAGVGLFRGFRNDRKMQDSLPLWQGTEEQGATGSIYRRGRPVPVLPQRQENAGSAAVVARGGGPGWPRKCLSQGTASSGASTTAGKCRIRCRCGMGRRTGVPQGTGNRSGRKGRRTGAIWNGGTSWSFLPKGLRRPHPRDFPHGDEGRQGIYNKYYRSHDQCHHQRGQERRSQYRPGG